MTPRAVRFQTVRELLELRDRFDGPLPKRVVCDRAQALGCSPSTVYRWLAEESDSRLSEVLPLTDDQIEVVFMMFGNVAAAKRELDRMDPEIAAVSERTFRRRWLKVDPAVRGMASRGADGMKVVQLRLLHNAETRNDVWHMDHHELPIWVIPTAWTTPVKPWCTTLIDDSTRRLMAVLLTMGRPSSEEVLVTIADGIRRKEVPGRGRVGGAPVLVHTDNGGEFRSGQTLEALARLGIDAKTTYPYMSHQNGKVERVQRTMQEDLVARLPGVSSGPQTLRGVELFGIDGPILGEAAFEVLFYAWPDEYNDRPHSALDGRSPNDAWFAQSTPLHEIDPEVIRLAMLKSPRDSYKVQPTGVWFGDRYYTSPDLSQWVGLEVQVRFMPSDNSFIEVFDGDKWITTAWPHHSLTDEDRKELAAISRRQYTQAKEHTKAAARRRAIDHGLDPSGLPGPRPLDGNGDIIRADADALLELLEEAHGPSEEEE